MKSALLALAVSWGCIILAAQPVDARIGEGKSQFESRALSNRTMIRYPAETVEAKISGRDVFYQYIYAFLPENAEHQVYYKRSDRSPASQSDLKRGPNPSGWDLHVIYVNGRSVMEVYRRNGASLSEAEFKGLLNLNRDDSFWVEAKRPADLPSVIRYQFVTDDGTKRAMRQNNFAIFIDSAFDEYLHAMRTQVEEARRIEAERTAPDSLAGF